MEINHWLCALMRRKTHTTDRNINGYSNELLKGTSRIYCKKKKKKKKKIRKNGIKIKLSRWLKELNLRRPKWSLR